MGIIRYIYPFNCRIIRVLIAVMALFFISTVVHAQEKESSEIHKTRSSAIIGGVHYYLHTVEKGQTLFAIAKFYGRDVNDIVIDNPEAIDGIKPGQVLKIAMDKKKQVDKGANDSTNYIFHKVEKGQTLYGIEKQYGVSDEKLRALNPELVNGLKLGQTIRIPKLGAGSVAKQEPDTARKNEKQASGNNAVLQQMLEMKGAADHVTASSYSYEGIRKESYSIACFLPFHCDDVNSMDIDKLIKGDEQLSFKSTVAIGFYQGVLLAIDSMKRTGMNAAVYFYDIDDSDSANIDKLLKKPELANMDLFIGPLYGADFMPVSKFAKDHHIAIVSPFIQINKILFNNPYVCKLAPSTTLQVEQMGRFVNDSLGKENLILVNAGNPKEYPFFNAFKSVVNENLQKNGAATDSVKIAQNVSAVQSMLVSGKENVVVLPTNNQSYVTEFLGKLNILSDKYSITVFGLQSWVNFDNLDFEYLNNLKVHLPSNYFVDYDNLSTVRIVQEYRSKFNADPDVYALQGYDAAVYFMRQLENNGTGFLSFLSQSSESGVQNLFRFSQYPSESGFENKNVFILKYQDYKLVRAN